MDAPKMLALFFRLLRSPPALAGALVFLALAILGGPFPILGMPGFDLGLAGALASALLVGPALGVTAARRELASDPGASSPAIPAAAAAGVATLLIALLLLASALRSALTSPCRALLFVPIFLLVALPSAVLATTVGVAAGLLMRGRLGRAVLLYALALFASLATTLLAAYFGPTASAYDHLLGVWPGPLYDEAIPVTRRLLFFRAGTLAWALAALTAASLVLRARKRERCEGAFAALAAALAAVALLWALGGRTPSRATLAEELGGLAEGPHCILHFPREKSRQDAERALRDCEYDATAVLRALGLARPPRATVYLYRSAEEKRELTGAGRTSFTKPWLAEIHVNDEGVPHPVLRHELVHALASAEAGGLLGVPARAGLFVNAGLVEGLAVALEVPEGNLDVHELTRVMRDEGELPPLSSLLGAKSFFGLPQARAYTAAGSFLRFLLDSAGPERVLAAYADDDVARGVGRPLAELEASWQRFLDRVVVPPSSAAAARARFERTSLFVRSCVREVASLEGEAARRTAGGEAAPAEALLRRASELSGGDPAFLRKAGEAWQSRGDLRRAEALFAEALGEAERTGGRHSLRVGLLGELGDMRWRRGDLPGARGAYGSALELGTEGGEERTLRAKLLSADRPSLGEALGPWLLGVGDPALALARAATSGDGLARYVLARARLSRGAPAAALEALGAPGELNLPGPEFEREARRMRALALCMTGRFDEGEAAFQALAADERFTGERQRALDSARRCAFERDLYHGPVPFAGDWPPS